MNDIFFGSVSVTSHNQEGRKFYDSEEETRKALSDKTWEEVRIVQKLLNDYQIDVPIVTELLKNIQVSVRTRKYAFTEEKAS